MSGNACYTATSLLQRSYWYVLAMGIQIFWDHLKNLSLNSFDLYPFCTAIYKPELITCSSGMQVPVIQMHCNLAFRHTSLEQLCFMQFNDYFLFLQLEFSLHVRAGSRKFGEWMQVSYAQF